ncbi:MAG: glycosyltransferase family 61 protein [Candidatus Nanopelagicales bacterium]
MAVSLESIAALDLADEAWEIAPVTLVAVPAVCRVSNLRETSGSLGAYLLDVMYAAGSVEVDALHLVRLPRMTRLVGDGLYTIMCGTRMVREQRLPGETFPSGYTNSAWRPEVVIEDECVMLARVGIDTWGHWLSELWPRAILAEQTFPGRFRFAVPRGVLEEPSDAWPRILESLEFVGIARDRLIPLDERVDYSFDSMWITTDVWSQRLIHPHALESMRRFGPSAIAGDRIYLKRTPSPIRALINEAEVESWFASRGFRPVEIGALTFEEQVNVFARAAELAGVRGSNFTGMIFSPLGVRVTAIAPPTYLGMVHAHIQALYGTLADIRGSMVEHGESFSRLGNRSFVVDVSTLERLLGDSL